jgi:hypothetical protein
MEAPVEKESLKMPPEKVDSFNESSEQLVESCEQANSSEQIPSKLDAPLNLPGWSIGAVTFSV